MGYVGQTKKKRYQRDKQHKKSYANKFEKALVKDDENNFQDWEVVTICQFETEVRIWMC